MNVHISTKSIAFCQAKVQGLGQRLWMYNKSVTPKKQIVEGDISSQKQLKNQDLGAAFSLQQYPVIKCCVIS